MLLLFVRWDALRAECILKDTCDISEVPIMLSRICSHPLTRRASFERILAAHPGAPAGDRAGLTPHGAAQAVMDRRPPAGRITL